MEENKEICATCELVENVGNNCFVCTYTNHYVECDDTCPLYRIKCDDNYNDLNN